MDAAPPSVPLRTPALEGVVRAALLGSPLPKVPEDRQAGVAGALARLGLAGLVVSVAERQARASGAQERGSARPSELSRDLEGALGAEAAEGLREFARRVGFETTLRLETGRRARALLGEAGIPMLLYKGAALLETGAYEDVRARPMSDVDLLVRPDHAARAVRALEAGGFRSWEPWTDAHLGWVSSFALEDGQAPAGVASTVDLHWATDYGRLRHGAGWSGETLWWDRPAEDPAGTLPAPEPHFVVTAEHFLKHLRVTVHLLGVADLVRLLSRLEHPERVVRHARARGTLPGVRAVVGALEVLGAPVPAGLLEALGGRRRVLREGARARLDAGALLARAEGAGPWLRDWTTLRGVWGTVAEAARVLAPSAGWLRARYPGASGGGSRRLRYLGDCVRWVLAGGPSPLSPNQELP